MRPPLKEQCMSGLLGHVPHPALTVFHAEHVFRLHSTCCLSGCLQELLSKLEESRAEVDRLEGELGQVGDRHSNQLQQLEEKVGA
jgi:hypothetical protein